MRILMISGILTPGDERWDAFRAAFKKRLPGAKFCVATEPWCHLWEIDRFRKFTLRTAAKFDTGEDTIMIGHSLGGVMACAVQSLFCETRVLGITTVHSPHRFFGGIMTKVLHAYDVTAPIVSVQGMHDGLVWWGSKHPRSIRHVRNHANHISDLIEFPENADLIAEITVQTFITNRETTAAAA